MKAENVCNCRRPSNYCHVAFIKVVESTLFLFSSETRPNRLRRIRATLNGHLRHSRQRLPLCSLRPGEIPDDEDVRKIRYREIRVDLDPPQPIRFSLRPLCEFAPKFVRCDP